MFRLNRNERSHWSGNGVHVESELVFMIGRNMQQDVFDYIEMFYNPKRRHSFNHGLSPVECEKQYFERLESV